jgi:hypothetical protein
MNNYHVKFPRKQRKSPVSKAGKPVGIRTERLPNTIFQHFRYTSLLNTFTSKLTEASQLVIFKLFLLCPTRHFIKKS